MLTLWIAPQRNVLQLVKDLMEPKPIVGIAHILGILLMKSYCFYSVDNFTRISNYLRSIPFSSEFAKFTFLLKTTSCLSVYVSLRGTTSLPRLYPSPLLPIYHVI